MRKELAKMFKDKKFLKEIAIILIVGIIVNSACFIMSCSYSKALSSSLPYVPQGENAYYNSEEVAYILDWLNRIPEYDPNAPTIVFLGSLHTYYDYNNNIDCKAYFVYQPVGTTLPTTWSSESDPNFHPNFANFALYSNDYLTLSFESGHKFTVTNRTIGNSTLYDGWECTYNESLSNQNKKFFGNSTPVDVSNSKFQYSYLVNYPVYCNMNFLTIDGTTQQGVWLSPGRETVIYPGEFTDLPPLDEVLNNISNSFNSHSNTTPPSYDPNVSDGENISNSIDSLADNINNAINNLGNNLKSWFDNLQKKLTDTTNAILGGLHDGFATLNQNFKDFFGAKLDGILEKLDYFQEPFSADELADNLNSANFSSDFLGLISTVGTFSTAFTSGSEPNSCSFTLDFSNSYYDFGVCEFSLDWILPFRSTIRLIVGCLCVYSLIVSIFTSLNTYIGGTSSINDDI